MNTETPLYRVTAPTYLGGAYHTPESQPDGGLSWDGAPNAALEPLNAAAKDRVKAYEADREKREAASQPLSDGKDTARLQRDLSAADARAAAAETRVSELNEEIAALKEERDGLAAQVAKFDHDGDGKVGGTAAQTATETDELADARTVPGDGADKLEAIERETDEANAAAAAKPKPNRSKDPEREAVKKALKDAGIKFFGGAPTDDLKKLLPG